MALFRNSPYRGDLTVQSHTPEDVFLQLAVSDRAVVQTDDFEPALVPAPDLTGVAPADQAEFTRAYYAARYPDYALAQGAPHLLASAPQLIPLRVDTTEHKNLLVQFHDHAGSDNLTPYIVTVIIEYEVPDLP